MYIIHIYMYMYIYIYIYFFSTAMTMPSCPPGVTIDLPVNTLNATLRC